MDAAPAVDGGEQVPDAGPLLDGQCTVGGIETGVLDPDCLYLMGTTDEGNADRIVIVNLAAPNSYRYGFGQYHADPVIRPSDGRLLYWDKRYNGDCRSQSRYCVFGWLPDATPQSFPYALDIMLANDTVIDTPACGFRRPLGPLVYPDDGATAYRCDGTTIERNRLYMEGESTVAFEGGEETPLVLGAGRAVLLANQTTMSVAMNGVRQQVDIGAFESVISARWIAGRFSIALLRNSSERIADLVTVGTGGDLTSVGTYDVGADQVHWYTCTLDLDGGLACSGGSLTGVDYVMKFSTDAPPTILYDESEHSVKIHGSDIVSGA